MTCTRHVKSWPKLEVTVDLPEGRFELWSATCAICGDPMKWREQVARPERTGKPGRPRKLMRPT